jgi:hypothetical protein
MSMHSSRTQRASPCWAVCSFGLALGGGWLVGASVAVLISGSAGRFEMGGAVRRVVLGCVAVGDGGVGGCW